MKIKNLGVIFGGMSTENEVSVVSASSILENLDKEKYNIYPIYISKDGNWWKYDINEQTKGFGVKVKIKEKIENITEYLKKLDVVFPVLHGKYGEDGTIQGMLEMLKIPYVGCHVLSACLGMDKVYSKIIFEKAGLNQAKYEYIRKYKDKYIYVDNKMNENVYTLEEVAKLICKNLEFPVYVKPSNSGSSVGINKSKNKEELIEHIEYASKFDNKILIEQQIIGQEVECAVLGNEEVMASCIGEVLADNQFYTYDEKYKSQKTNTKIPADLPEEISEKIRKEAIKAFKAIDGKGLSRVDFFVEKETNKIYINEINTLPGFTNISMYPKLFEKSGISCKDLLNKVIELAYEF